MRKVLGLTGIELIAIILFGALVATILLYQKANITASQRDETRKTAINAMHHNLEQVFYQKNGYYPSTINSTVLKAVDPDLFTDPDGAMLGDPGSDYRYDAIDCGGDRCNAYKLTARLDKEADYIKTNRN